jgi:hypothetical protein
MLDLIWKYRNITYIQDRLLQDFKAVRVSSQSNSDTTPRRSDIIISNLNEISSSPALTRYGFWPLRTLWRTVRTELNEGSGLFRPYDLAYLSPDKRGLSL